MVLLVVGVIVLMVILLTLLGAILAVVLLVRHWKLLRPMAVACLLLLGGLAFFDTLASDRTVRCAETGKPVSSISKESLPRELGHAAPEWTHRTPGEMNTAREVVEITVHAGPCLSLADCEVQLAKELIRTVDDYLRSEIATTPGVEVEVSPQFIEEHLVKSTYTSHSKREVVSSLGPQDMVDLYALVKIDAEGRNQLRNLWRENVVQGRMKAAGGALVAVLAALTVGWAILRRPRQPAPVEARRQSP